jgi:hypothetical protein
MLMCMRMIKSSAVIRSGQLDGQVSLPFSPVTLFHHIRFPLSENKSAIHSRSFHFPCPNIFGLVSCMPAFPVAAALTRVNWLPPSFLRFAPGRPLPPKQLVRSLGQLGRQRRRSGSQNALQHSACVVHIPDLPGVRRSGGFSRLQGAAKGAKTPPNLFSSITCTTFEWVVQIIKLKRFKDAPQTELERKWNLSCYSCSSLETTIHITFGTTLILRLSLH